MTAALHHLGDTHNFGRRVTQRRGRIVKPRTLLWEWLLLATASPLRRRLSELASVERLGHGTFDFLPSLAFSTPHARQGGDVEPVDLKPLSRPSRRPLALVAGRALALFSWLGLADLHWENLVLGADPRSGRIVFAPLDVEIILADLSLPAETKLLPDADPAVAAVCRHSCGARRLLPFLGKPVDGKTLVTMAEGYRDTLALLDRGAGAIAEALKDIPNLRETPIRVLLRGTDEYVRARSEPVWPPLLDAEAVQLARGDIPYFFRLYGRPGIHFYSDESLERVARIPSRGDVPRLAPLLSLARGLRSPSRTRLREEGLLTVLGAFDHPKLEGSYASSKLTVTFARRSLVVSLEDGDQLETRRDMSAFVGSVYSPCSCGEVRSVLVPSVTMCRASAGTFG